MDATPHADRLRALPGDDLPQIVPTDVCLACDVCCRFPERESFLRPYFTAEETARAIAFGASPESFPQPAGGRIRLAPHPDGEGFICPCFDHRTQECAIYPVRPLDCRLYPLSLMRDEAGRALVLGLDTKCPYVRDPAHAPRLDAYARRVGRTIESGLRDVVHAHPDLVGRYQDDVAPRMTLGPLPPSRP